MKSFHIALGNELWERELPGLLPMVGEPAEFLRIQPELPRHLDMQIAQVKSPLGVRPGVEASFRLFHDVSFPLQTCGLAAQRTGANTGIPHHVCRAPRPPRGPDGPLPAVSKDTTGHGGHSTRGSGLSPATAGTPQAAAATVYRSHRSSPALALGDPAPRGSPPPASPAGKMLKAFR